MARYVLRLVVDKIDESGCCEQFIEPGVLVDTPSAVKATLAINAVESLGKTLRTVLDEDFEELAAEVRKNLARGG
jgi:hypothetical protein